MSLGDTKSKVFSEIVCRAKANHSTASFTAVECGSYCGYSTVLLGSLLDKEDRLISIESNPQFSEITSKLCSMANLKNVDFVQNTSEKAIKKEIVFKLLEIVCESG